MIRVETWQLVVGAAATILSSTALSQVVSAVAGRRKTQVDADSTVGSMTIELANAVTANADRAQAAAVAARAEADEARRDAEEARRDLRACRRASEEAIERMRVLEGQMLAVERRMQIWQAAVWQADATIEGLRVLVGRPDP